jgi:hypothetical protein
MKPPNSFLNIGAVWTIALFTGCHPGNTNSQPGAQQKMEPPLPMPYFTASDTIIKAAPADTEVYGIIKAALTDPHLYENTKPTRFCDISLTEVRDSPDFSVLIRKKLASANDTIGFKTVDTIHYRLDWAKVDDRKSITVKEVAHGFRLLLHSGALGPSPDHLRMQNAYADFFHCNVLACVSYPRLNYRGDLAVIEMSESFNLYSSGSCFYFLKKSGNKWKLIYTQFIWAS